MTRASTALRLASIILPLTLSGCTYNYLNHNDGVTLAGGNAVRANLERETANPTSRSRHSVKGLGRNGSVISEEEATASVAPAPSP